MWLENSSYIEKWIFKDKIENNILLANDIFHNSSSKEKKTANYIQNPFTPIYTTNYT